MKHNARSFERAFSVLKKVVPQGPLVKGGCHGEGRDWGIRSRMLRICRKPMRDRKILLRIPPTSLPLGHLPLTREAFDFEKS